MVKNNVSHSEYSNGDEADGDVGFEFATKVAIFGKRICPFPRHQCLIGNKFIDPENVKTESTSAEFELI